ncbi:hypothetical protein X801_04674, partial [Opisthorchis viverrini]
FKEEPPKPPTYSQYVRRLAKVQARVGQSKSLPSQSALQPVETGDLMTSLDQGYSTMTTVVENTFYENEKSEVVEKDEKQVDDEVESHRTLKSTGANKSGYKQQLLSVLKNVNFMLLLVSYGINTGIYYAVGTLLNPILAQYFGGNPNIGWIGFTMIVAGILGSVLAGICLDKTKKYRLVILITYAIALVWMCGFTGLLLLERIDVAFVASFFLGLAMTGFLPIGFEFAAELTYPADEGLTSGLLNASAQVFGIIFITSASSMVGLYDVKYTNTYFTVLLAVGFLLLYWWIKPENLVFICTIHKDGNSVCWEISTDGIGRGSARATAVGLSNSNDICRAREYIPPDGKCAVCPTPVASRDLFK